ncbi:prepilin-type N-terminal cleavage/methylation domain-containing protein [Desulfuromonas acetoxidans]|uniref:type IV pilus modification PilV family protein n=1 Tax=Desulfuromonas acetoxidans TaxID=891 RepID=UPI00292E83D4|nr:prepilin-type N-terminal cleavage/methylation domain-containing protein [Desulfuromonas acetoxidans]
MPCKTTSNKEAGFSLIELLVALTIFAIGLLALAGMQVTALRGNSHAHGVTVLTALADGIIEDLWARSGDDEVVISETAGAVSWPADFNDPDTAQEWNIEGAGLCTATYQVTLDTPIVGVSTIVVEVASPDRSITKQILKRTY